MRDNLLSALFGSNQFTGAAHTQTVTLLTMIGSISIIVFICIALSAVIRHATILALRIAARTRRRAMLRIQSRQP